ncbi:MAG: hypothetical protein WDA22_03015 [Bacteroidota bacterium]
MCFVTVHSVTKSYQEISQAYQGSKVFTQHIRIRLVKSKDTLTFETKGRSEIKDLSKDYEKSMYVNHNSLTYNNVIEELQKEGLKLTVEQYGENYFVQLIYPEKENKQ